MPPAATQREDGSGDDEHEGDADDHEEDHACDRDRRRLARSRVAEQNVQVVHRELLGRRRAMKDTQVVAARLAAQMLSAGPAFVHVLVAASRQGEIVRGPVRGSEHMFVAVSQWLGAAPDPRPGPDALVQDDLVERLQHDEGVPFPPFIRSRPKPPGHGFGATGRPAARPPIHALSVRSALVSTTRSSGG